MWPVKRILLTLGLFLAPSLAFAQSTQDIGTSGTAQGIVKLESATSGGSVAVQAPATASARTITLPGGAPTNTYLVQTDGSGSWSYFGGALAQGLTNTIGTQNTGTQTIGSNLSPQGWAKLITTNTHTFDVTTASTTDLGTVLESDYSLGAVTYTLPNPSTGTQGRILPPISDYIGSGFSVTTAGGTALFQGFQGGGVATATFGPWSNVTCTDAGTYYACQLSGFQRSGNQFQVASQNGTIVSGNCPQEDSGGNLSDSGAACNSGVTSVTTACPASSSMTGAVTLSGAIAARAVSGSTDTLQTTDCGGAVNYTGSGVATTLAAAGASGYPVGYQAWISNVSATGSATLTPSSGTINGASSVTLAAGQSALLWASASNAWQLLAQSSTYTPVATFSTVGNDTRLYPLDPNTLTGTGSAQASGTMVCRPWVQQQGQHWDELVASITTAGTSNTQFAIYSDALNGSGYHQPNALLYSSGSIANNATAPDTITWSIGTGGTGSAVSSGPQWVCLNSNDSTVVFVAINPISTYIASLIGSTSASHVAYTSNVVGLKATETFGTWPSSLSSTSFTEVTTGTVPAYGYRVATVP